ncbi:unnamed protein product [Gadus morhua 'NCC']
MSPFLGSRDSVESLRKDLIDLQGAILEVFSRTGPVRCSSWKFPDKLSCNLDLVSLLEQYDHIEGDDEFNQYSYIVLLELVIDRLLLLLQSFSLYTVQLRSGPSSEHSQKQGCVSVGLIVRHYWSNLIELANLKDAFKESQGATKINPKDCEEKKHSLSLYSGSQSSRASLLSSSSSLHSFANNEVNAVPTHPNFRPSPTVLCTPTRKVSCQTVESSLVPCDACDQVQCVLRQTGDCLVELCQSEGLPSSLQPLLVAVEDTVELGHLSAGDLAQWAREQRRDMGRLGKHLREVRGTVQPLTDRLTAAEKEGEKAKDRLERAQEGAKKEREKYLASKRQMELLLREAQRSVTEKERRLQEEQQRLLRSNSIFEDQISKLKEELAAQLESLNTLEREKGGLVKMVKALRTAEEAHLKLQGRTQLLESQMADMQLSLNKESSKYQSACHQQVSMQAQEKSLVERMETLDQEREELQSQLEKSEARQSQLQDQLNHVTEEKKTLLDQSAPQQVLCAELQGEKDLLEAQVEELKSIVGRLDGEVKDLSHRERLLVAFPELATMHLTQPQSSGNVLFDMEQQLEANHIRIELLEKENTTLRNSLVTLNERYISTMGSSPEEPKYRSPQTPPSGDHRVETKQTQCFSSPQGDSSRAAQLKPDPRRGAGGGEGGPDYIGWGDDFSSIATTRASPTASRSSPSSALLLLNGHILQSKTGRGRGSGRFKTLGQTRHAYLADRAAANRGSR